MQTTGERLLKNFLQEVVSASKDYMKKEAVRQSLQDSFAAMIAENVSTDEELASFFKSVEMSVSALKMIPLEVWQKLRG